MMKDKENFEEKQASIIKTVVTVLAILGLISAAVVVARQLYLRLKNTVADFNKDLASGDLKEGDLLSSKKEDGAEEGCQVETEE